MARPPRGRIFRRNRRPPPRSDTFAFRAVTVFGTAVVAVAWLIAFHLGTLEIEATRVLLPTERGHWILGGALALLHLAAFGALALLAGRHAALRRTAIVGALGFLVALCWGGTSGIRDTLRGRSGPEYDEVQLNPVAGGVLFQAVVHTGQTSDLYLFLEPTASRLFQDEFVIVAGVRMTDRPAFAPILTPIGRSSTLRFPPNGTPSRILVTRDGHVAVRAASESKVGWILVRDAERHVTLWPPTDERAGFLSLLGPEDLPDPTDVTLLTARAARVQKERSATSRSEDPTLPTGAELVAALDDARPQVRDAAVAIAKAGGPGLYPKVFEALATKGR
jgi:hypothetical protein